MTGKPEDDGLAEIKRLLRSLDETSAGEPRAPNDPRSVWAKPDASRELASDKPPQDAIILAPPASPIAVGKMPPPPATGREGARPWPLAIALIAGAAAASGAAIWWSNPGLLPAQLLSARAVGGADQPRERVSPPVAPQGHAERPPAVEAAAGRGPSASPPESAPPSGPPPRVAQAVRSQSAITDAPRSPNPTPEPRLRVPARLMATAGESASLPIEIDGPAQASQTSVLIVKGLPAGASLSKGTVLATGDWSLIASEATGLAIALPSSAAGRHQLTIEMRSSDAGVIASVRSMLEVANTPSRAGMADAVRPPEATTLEWLGEAKRLMSAGHIASARLLLERAADSGLAEAARLLGDTYDPAKLYALGVRGVSGDIQRAINWYERADELGDPQAKARLLALGAR